MGKIEDLAAKLEKEKKDSELRNIDNDAIKEQWQEDLNLFFSNMKAWLKPLIDKNLIKLVEEKKTIDNESFGPYMATFFSIFSLRQTVLIQPIGRFILGAKGRVDIKSSKKTVMVVLHDDGWKIVQKKERGFDYINLNEDSFAELFEELLTL